MATTEATTEDAPADPVQDDSLAFENRTRRLLAAQRFAQALRAIITQLGPDLRGYFRRVLASDSEGEDSYQDLLLALWRGLPNYKMSCSVRTWVYAIAHHLIFRRRRRYSRKNVFRLDTKKGQALAAPQFDSHVEYAGRRERLSELQSMLSLTERELLVLRSERGLSFAEIAVILQVSEPAVRKRFQRLVERLQELTQQAD